MSTLVLDSASRWFGNVVAVNDVTMTIGPGVHVLAGNDFDCARLGIDQRDLPLCEVQLREVAASGIEGVIVGRATT